MINVSYTTPWDMIPTDATKPIKWPADPDRGVSQAFECHNGRQVRS